MAASYEPAFGRLADAAETSDNGAFMRIAGRSVSEREPPAPNELVEVLRAGF